VIKILGWLALAIVCELFLMGVLGWLILELP
jgi:hypothetical protein